MRVGEACRQRAGLGIAVAECFLRGQNARGAGADHDRDPPGAIAGAGAGDLCRETILPQRQIREAVVAAVIGGEGWRQAMLLHRRHPADMAIADAAEIAAAEARLPVAERGEHRRAAKADRADGGEMGQAERGGSQDLSSGCSPTNRKLVNMAASAPTATVAPISRNSGVRLVASKPKVASVMALQVIKVRRVRARSSRSRRRRAKNRL
jgi:hypothetical protein